MVDTLRNLGPTRLLITAGVIAAVLALFFVLTTRLTAPSMALLYSDLTTNDSGRIVTKLESMNVPYELRGNGTSILVPNDQVARLRMAIAQEGLPSGGSMGYELFDRSEALGTSSFVLNINHVRALEGELARTIGSLAYVRSARVHLAMPRRELFTRDQQDPTASVVLQMNGGRRLDKAEVQGIQNLVAAAVPKLRPSRISIIDGQGTLLSRVKDNTAGGSGADNNGSSAEEIKNSYEARAARTLEEMLERIVGPGRVRAEVTAEMDFDRISTTSETFDPDGQVVRSTQNVEETSRSRDGEVTTNVSVASNIPAPLNQGQPQAPTQNGSTAQSNRNEETVNYEISRTTKTHIRESGIVKRISVAVVVDGSYPESSGQRSYQPRSAEDLEQLSKLVKSAVGYDEKRGDTVEVVNLRFVQGAEMLDNAPRPLFGLEKSDYIRIAEMVTLGIVAILVIFLVIRPLVRRVLESIPDAIASSKNLISDSVAAANRPALPGAEGAGGLVPIGMSSSGEGAIDMQQIEGRVRESSIKKISEIVDKHPEEAVNIIRNWMHQES